jgi:hypothetical protein
MIEANAPGSRTETTPISRLLLPAVVAALFTFVYAAWQFLNAPEHWLLQIVPDDAFYYLDVARNLVETGRSTADGVFATNGYHPAWMVAAVLLARVFRKPEVLLRAIVAVSLVLHLSVAAVLQRCLRSIVGHRWAWTASVCWLLNPLAYLIASQATEASIYALAALIAFSLHLRLDGVKAGSGPPSVTSVAAFGASLGFVFLARTEGVVILGVGLLWLAWRARSLKLRGGHLLAAVIASVVVIAPWLYFSWREVGTIVQDSGAMKLLWARDIVPGPGGWVRNLLDTADFFGRRLLGLMLHADVPKLGVLVAASALGVAVGLVMLRNFNSREARALRAVIVPTVITVVTYGFTLVERQIWWLTLPCLAILLLTFVTLPTLLDSSGVTRTVHAMIQAVVVIACIGLFVRAQHRPTTLYPWQPDVRSSQRDIDDLVPGSERLGSFNAGIPIYFSSRPVIALEGLINHQVELAWQDRRLGDFLRDEHISFIADEQRALNQALRFMGPTPTFQRVTTFPLTGWPTKERVLWQLSFDR